MAAPEVVISRKRVIAVLIANAVLWVAVLFVTHNAIFGGAGAAAIISIGSLLRKGRPVA